MRKRSLLSRCPTYLHFVPLRVFHKKKIPNNEQKIGNLIRNRLATRDATDTVSLLASQLSLSRLHYAPGTSVQRHISTK